MELDHKVTVYDKAAEPASGTYGEWSTRVGDVHSPRVDNAEPLRRCLHFLELVRGEGDPLELAKAGLAVVRSLEQLQTSPNESAP